MPIMWSNCRLCCQMNFWKANCMTSLIRCLIHSQAFKLMELYWFVCCYSKSTSLSLTRCLPLSVYLLSLLVCSLSPMSNAAHPLPSIYRTLLSYPLSLSHRGWMCLPASTLCRPLMAVCGTASALPQTCWRVSACQTAWQSKFQSEETRQPLTFSLQPARLGWWLVAGEMMTPQQSLHIAVAKIIIQKKISDVIWN